MNFLFLSAFFFEIIMRVIIKYIIKYIIINNAIIFLVKIQ
jgi:hypothetical protein